MKVHKVSRGSYKKNKIVKSIGANKTDFPEETSNMIKMAKLENLNKPRLN